MDNSPFSKLPLELRREIYRLAIPVGKTYTIPVIQRETRLMQKTPPPKVQKTAPVGVALLHICGEIRHEAFEYVYGGNTLAILDPGCWTAFAHWLSGLPSGARHALKSLELGLYSANYVGGDSATDDCVDWVRRACRQLADGGTQLNHLKLVVSDCKWRDMVRNLPRERVSVRQVRTVLTMIPQWLGRKPLKLSLAFPFDPEYVCTRGCPNFWFMVQFVLGEELAKMFGWETDSPWGARAIKNLLEILGLRGGWDISSSGGDSELLGL